MNRSSILKKLSPHLSFTWKSRNTLFLISSRLLFPPYPKDLDCPHIPSSLHKRKRARNGIVARVGCNVCSRKNARGQAETEGASVSSWNGGNGFSVARCFVVMVTGYRSFCNRCVQLRRLALPRTANRYSAPETGSTLRRRETGLTSGSRDNPSWGVS